MYKVVAVPDQEQNENPFFDYVWSNVQVILSVSIACLAIGYALGIYNLFETQNSLPIEDVNPDDEKLDLHKICPDPLRQMDPSLDRVISLIKRLEPGHENIDLMKMLIMFSCKNEVFDIFNFFVRVYTAGLYRNLRDCHKNNDTEFACDLISKAIERESKLHRDPLVLCNSAKTSKQLPLEAPIFGVKQACDVGYGLPTPHLHVFHCRSKSSGLDMTKPRVATNPAEFEGLINSGVDWKEVTSQEFSQPIETSLHEIRIWDNTGHEKSVSVPLKSEINLDEFKGVSLHAVGLYSSPKLPLGLYIEGEESISIANSKHLFEIETVFTEFPVPDSDKEKLRNEVLSIPRSRTFDIKRITVFTDDI